MAPRIRPADPDTQCAVVLRKGSKSARCTVSLACSIHSWAQKHAVTDRSQPLDVLLAQQSRFLVPQPHVPVAASSFVDLDVQCGVLLSSGELCRMNLHCREHNLAQKRAVVGRTADLSALVQVHAETDARLYGPIDTDTQCGVLLSDGRKCTRKLNCTSHNSAAKRAVLRSADWKVLRDLHKDVGATPKTKTEGELEKKRVRDLINTTMNKEFAIVYPDKDNSERAVELAETYRHLSRFQIAQDGTYAWEDAYSVQPITVSSRGLSCSFEAAKPLVWYKGRAREHIFSNTVLTTEYANKLCDSYPGIALRVLHELDAAVSSETRAQLVERLDHLHLIRSQIPWSGSKRLALQCKPAFMDDFTTQCNTGVATLSGCAYIAHHNPGERFHAWRITGESESSNLTKDDQCEKIDEVRQFVVDLEAASQTPFPRINDVPYPFEGGPAPAFWSWTMFYRIFRYRLIRLRKHCNSRDPTEFDVPELICAILYLLHTGKRAQPMALLNLPVSIYTRHILRMSIGKADHSRGMTSGFTSRGLITLASFDINECNLCVEPWACNNAKGNVDSQIDAIRNHFRTHFKTNNPQLWSTNFLPLDQSVTTRYIRDGLISLDGGDEEDDAENGETGSEQHSHGPAIAPVTPAMVSNSRTRDSPGMSALAPTFAPETTGSEQHNHGSAIAPVTAAIASNQRKRDSPDMSALASTFASVTPRTAQQDRFSRLFVRGTGSPGRAPTPADSHDFVTHPDTSDETSGSRKSSRGDCDSDISSARRDEMLGKEIAGLKAGQTLMKGKLEAAEKKLRLKEQVINALLAEREALLEENAALQKRHDEGMQSTEDI